jgi:hypothetical protein
MCSAGQGTSPPKGGAYFSWLEATPTIFIHHIVLHILGAKNMWDPALREIFENFKWARNEALGQKMCITEPI